MATPAQSGPALFRFAKDFKSVAAGESIFKAGEIGDLMYSVKEGEVEVLVGDRVVETVGPGGILGEMALIDRQPRSATAVAKTDCTLVPVNEERFKYLIQQTPYFAIEVMRVMARRLRQMDAR